MKLSKEEVRKALSEGVVSLTFTKVNGDKRVVPEATTSSEFIPVPTNNNVQNTESKRERKINDDIITFYSIEDNGFRSCRYDSLIEVS